MFLREASFTKLNEFESFGRFQRVLELENSLRYVLDILLSLVILQKMKGERFSPSVKTCLTHRSLSVLGSLVQFSEGSEDSTFTGSQSVVAVVSFYRW